MDDTLHYRRRVYERFAELVHRENVRWVMLHGAEDYPQSIGRDLDCLCAGRQEASVALRCFQRAAQEQAETKWILFPHPIWGRRCVALSADYQAAELHILDCLSSGLLHHGVNFDAVNRDAVFPQEPMASYIKSVVMPLLGNSPKVLRTLEKYDDIQIPDCVQHAARTLREQGYISLRERLSLYAHHMENPLCAVSSLVFSLKKKVRRYFSRTVPVYVMQPHEADYLMAHLGEVFLKSVDCTHMSAARIRCLQAQQILLYVQKKAVFPEAVALPELREEALCDYVVECFASLCSTELT